MSVDRKFLSFYDNYSEEFEEHLDSVKVYLNKYNKDYKRLQVELNNILDNNLKIQEVVFNNDIKSVLSLEELKELARVIEIHLQMQNIAEKEIYFKGGMDAYLYFDKIGILKSNNLEV